MIEGEMSPEVTAWIVEQSLATPPLIAANLIADVCFANYLEEAKQVDANIRRSSTLPTTGPRPPSPFLAKHCPTRVSRLSAAT